MTGKEKCEFLRNIRKNIAEMNDLDYEPTECTHEGWCPGYCPVCDAESADLMHQLERKEASGAPIRIDTESIKAIDEMAMQYSRTDDDDDDQELTEMGDVIEPLQGIECAPTDEDEDTDANGKVIPEEEICIPAGLPLPPIPTEEELKCQKFYEERHIDWWEYRYDLDHLCKGCVRYNTIQGDNGKPTRCSALSEHFFERALERGTCFIKKTIEDEESPLDEYKKSRKGNHGG